MKQTAVEFLVSKLNPYGLSESQILIFEQAIEMEKQQIIDSISNANKSNNRNISLNPEQYYNETYNKQ
jgi:hypothetical protein